MDIANYLSKSASLIESCEHKQSAWKPGKVNLIKYTNLNLVSQLTKQSRYSYGSVRYTKSFKEWNKNYTKPYFHVGANATLLDGEIKSSVYLSGRYNYRRVSRRPLVAPDYNPALHDQDALLVGGGLYREKFYTANMIYGFGTREYLATGYKAEVTTGYSWGEFNDALYLGASYETGGFRRLGYIMGGFTLGSYIDLENGMWQRSAVDVDLRWFSNLFLFKRSRIRQFLAFNYTQGWNRATGSDESIRFTRTDGLQALKEYIIGTNRMILNTETVVFTPYQPLGFRIAVFGFADFGLIGYSPNIFKNDFFTSFGLGVRLRNERLVFNTIQIRLGVAFGKRGLVESEYFRLSNPTRMEQYRYRPTRPEIVEFK